MPDGIGTWPLTNKFKVEKIKMDIFGMKKLDIEFINDFVYRVERDTRDLNLPDQLHVQIAVGGLHPTVQSAISSHGPKNLDDVRTLANLVQQPIAAVSSVNTQHEGPLTRLLELLQKPPKKTKRGPDLNTTNLGTMSTENSNQTTAPTDLTTATRSLVKDVIFCGRDRNF